MSHIKVVLPKDRNFAGRLSIYHDDGALLAGPFPVAGRASDATAAAHGNASRDPLMPYGDTPLGSYRTGEVRSMRGSSVEEIREFGRFGVITLNAVSGEALQAERAGRGSLWIHGGELSANGDLYPSNGSLRLRNEHLHVLLEILETSESIECHCLAAPTEASYDERVLSDAPQRTANTEVLPLLGRAAKRIAPFAWASLAARTAFAGSSSYESGTNFSQVDLSVITKNEGGNLSNGYWPGGNSGVTIGIGVDLGQQSAAGLANMGVPQNVIDELSGYLGLQGTAAQTYLQSNPLSLNATDLAALNTGVTTSYFNGTGASFNGANNSGFANFSALPPQAQTVIADLSYNLGSLASAAPNFWSQVTNGQWNEAVSNLMNFTSPSNTALYNRAQSDGQLLQSAITNGSLPNK